MKEKTDIDQIIANFLSGGITDFETKKLEEWKTASPQNAYQLEKLRELWQERSIDRKTIHSSEIKRNIWQQGVESDLTQSRATNQRFISSVLMRRFAAVFVLFSILGIIYLIAENSTRNNSIEIAQQLITKSNPPGQKSKIFLSDGSVVWLNANSSISYLKHFTDSCRKVTLNGEAFFEVAKDSLSPFTVNSNGVNVEVLGTQFNVKTGIIDERVTIALLEGLVKVFTENDFGRANEKLIYPGEGIVLSSQHDQVYNFTFDPTDLYNPYSSWKDGILTFNGDNYDEFVTKIQLWYGIEVHAVGSPRGDWDIRANFSNELLDNIMKSISYNKGFKYKIDREKLMLNFN